MTINWRIVGGLALAALPLILLGLRNWRAVPLGGLIMAFTGVGSIGALTFGALGSGARAALVATVLTIVVLFFVNTHFVATTPAARNRWGMASFAAWFIAVFIYLVVPGPAINEMLDERNRVEYEAWEAGNAAKAKADSARKRPPDSTPEGRTPRPSNP